MVLITPTTASYYWTTVFTFLFVAEEIAKANNYYTTKKIKKLTFDNASRLLRKSSFEILN